MVMRLALALLSIGFGTASIDGPEIGRIHAEDGVRICYTHLRFYTRQTLDDWLGRFGFEDFEIVPQRTELPPEFGGLGPEFVVDRCVGRRCCGCCSRFEA